MSCITWRSAETAGKQFTLPGTLPGTLPWKVPAPASTPRPSQFQLSPRLYGQLQSHSRPRKIGGPG